MKALRPLLLLAAVLALGSAPAASQEPEGAVTVPAPPSAVGERFTVILEVTTPAGATVDVDPLAPGWDGVEVLEQHSATVYDDGPGEQRHRLEITVAAFLPGERALRPSVLVTGDGAVEARQLGPVPLSVPTTLDPAAPLELTGPQAPAAIPGAAPPYLAPALVAAAAVVLLALVYGLRWLWQRRPVRPLRPPAAAPEAVITSHGQLPGAAELVTDPVAAYRTMSHVVREALATHYGLPANALTTTELQRRMQRDEVDRWQARLVAGLLQNCDLVLYAGFQPPRERREADLGMAQEIMEGLQ